MEIKTEAAPAPTSDVAKEAIAELQKEGHQMGENSVNENELGQVIENEIPPKEEPKKEEPKPEPKKEEKVEEPAKEPSRIPTWRVKIEEKRWEKEKKEMQAKIDELSKPGTTVAEKKEISDDIDALAKEFGLDEANTGLIKKLRDSILKNVTPPKELVDKVEELELEKTAINQEKLFNQEFEKDVLPLIKAEYPNATEESLAQAKAKLLESAFAEQYLKVPLKKIFRAEQEDLGIQEASHKKSIEGGKSGQNRATDSVDFDKMDEETFERLSDDKKIEFSNYMSSKKWK